MTLERARRGDTAAATALVRRYERVVATSVGRILGRDHAEVLDVTQEAFLRALSSLARFDAKGPAKLSTWIVTIATRVALDHLRRRRRYAPEVDFDQWASTDPTPHEALDEAQRRASLDAAMRRLSPEHRAVMLLRVEHAMDYEAIAAALAIEVGTVRSRLSRAKEALRLAIDRAQPNARSVTP